MRALLQTSRNGPQDLHLVGEVLGMRDGMFGHLDQCFGAAVRRGFGEHIAVRVRLAGERLRSPRR